MACKYCHKKSEVKQTLVFEQGKRYLHSGTVYLCARVSADLFALVSLDSGNRWASEPSTLDRISDGNTDFREVK